MAKTPKLAKEAVLEAAALHYAAGALDSQDVPVGLHDLSGMKVMINFPKGAAVERTAGSRGDGYDEYTPAASKGLNLAAVLLFLERSGSSGPQHLNLWLECIRDSFEKPIKAEEHMPAEVLEALQQVQVKLQDGCKAQRKTPAKRVGIDLVKVQVKPSRTASLAKA